MFVDQSDTATIEQAIDAGVATYVVDGLRKERVKPILDTTISRFNAFKKLRDELHDARQALDERKLIDRAKGILMKQHQLSEADAYEVLRKNAMNENRRIVAIANQLVTGTNRRRGREHHDSAAPGGRVFAASRLCAASRGRGKGFAAAEGLEIELIRETSWANIRDRVIVGQFHAAHMLGPMAIASTLGIAHLKVPMIAPLAMGAGATPSPYPPRSPKGCKPPARP